jgi:DnaJ family protein B protein 4
MPGMGGMGGIPTDFGGANGFSQARAPREKRAEPIEYNFNVTLEDLYNGTTKRMRITKKAWDAASNRAVPISVEKEIPIK